MFLREPNFDRLNDSIECGIEKSVLRVEKLFLFMIIKKYTGFFYLRKKKSKVNRKAIFSYGDLRSEYSRTYRLFKEKC